MHAQRPLFTLSNLLSAKLINGFHLSAINSLSRYRRSMTSSRMMSQGMTSHSPDIGVVPNRHLLVDDKLQIDIRGLRTNQSVTVHATMAEDGKRFESCCCFDADDNGVVSLHKQPSLSGTYTGVSAMGLFWSMVPEPGQMDGIRLMKKDVDTPYSTHVSVYDGHLSLEDIRASQPTHISLGVIDRWYKGPGVTSVNVKEGRTRGKLFLPPGAGPFPGVIDMFGSAGGLVAFRASLFASRGFATLALPYCQYADLPTTFIDLDLEYFLEAVDWLLSQNKVVPSGVGALGVSKGGEIALLLGAYCPKVLAIVNINGCTFNATFPIKYGGVEGGVIPTVEFEWDRIKQKGDYWILKDTLDYKEQDLTPVWNHDAKVLNILSEDDLCSPNECIRLMKRCFPPNKADNFVVMEYPGAGHLVEPPYTPLCSHSYQKSFSNYMMWGGQPEPHAHAQEDSWRRILEHFRTYIPTSLSR